MMAASATLLTVETPERHHKAVLPHQPALATESVELHHMPETQQRRERDEVHPHYHGYGVSQRTPARSGRA